jgi:putative transposase
VLLGELGISQSWPCWGAPATLHLDNASEFHSDMMMRACEQYSINLEFRPLLKPNYGGHIERLMGTVANEMRRIPGTTFSNPRQKGEYNAKKHSGITLPLLEKLLVRWITGGYHQKIHSTLKMPPIKKWELGIFGDGEKPGSGLRPRPTDALQIHLDLLPYKTGTVQPYGIQWDNVRYYSDALRPYIGSGKKFSFKRDPRNISELYFVDPETGRYTAIPYRDTRLPALSIWELRAINAEARKQGRLEVDESAIREVYEQNAAEVKQAVVETRKVRRDRARREHRKSLPAFEQRFYASEDPPTRQDNGPLTAFEIEDL